jgi:hypothetical protein
MKKRAHLSNILIQADRIFQDANSLRAEYDQICENFRGLEMPLKLKETYTNIIFEME